MKFGLILLAFCINNSYGKNKQYIVTLRDASESVPKSSEIIQKYLGDLPGFKEGFSLKKTYEHSINGFLATIPESMIKPLQRMAFVENVEEDAPVQMYLSQKDSPWGLSRLSQRKKISGPGPYTYNYKDNGGEGVSVYVIDSGVRISHKEFEGRAVIGKTFAGDNDNDENGHGTHVAATIGGKTFGVAKKAQIVALKVFDGSGQGSMSTVLSALEFVIKDKRGKRGNIVNMSLGGILSFSINRAVRTAHANGITVVVAAGNSGLDSYLFSPASAPDAITVGASTINDTMATFSNSGRAVDVLAPGQDILSAWNGGDSDQKIISGTSMACPHVAGLAAYLMSFETLTNKQADQKIKALATQGALTSLKLLTQNRLAFNGFE